MCRLKTPFFFLLSLLCLSSTVQASDETFSRRLAIQDSLDHCIHTTYLIRDGQLTQEEGLDQLEDSLEIVKFLCWFWIED